MQKEVDEKLFLNICFPTPSQKLQNSLKKHQINIRQTLSDCDIIRKLYQRGFPYASRIYKSFN